MLYNPRQKLQAAVEATALHILQIPTNPNAAAAMGLPHSLVSVPLCLPLREGSFDIVAIGVHPALPLHQFDRSMLAAL